MATKDDTILQLVDFMKKKKRADCPVCQLPEGVRTQLATAADKGIRVADQLDWLRAEVGTSLTRADLTAHRNGRHDDE